VVLSEIIRQNYTLRYRVSDGVYSDVTSVMIHLTPANMHPPEFTEVEYLVTDVVEKDQSAVGRLIKTVCYQFVMSVRLSHLLYCFCPVLAWWL